MHEIWLGTDLDRLPTVKAMGNAFTQDSGSNKVGVIVTKTGIPVALTGTVKGFVILPNGATIEASGSRENNKAWVVLPDSALANPGHIGVYVKLIGENTVTLGGVEGYVYKSM